MRKLLAPALLIVSLFALQGCMASSSASSNNPTANDVYYSEFASVPIPVHMQEQSKFTNVMYNIDGIKSGTQIFKGPLERQSLVNAMTHNMLREGWQARSIVSSGERNLLVFQNESRMAVFTLSENSSFSSDTMMDVWVVPYLPDGVVKPPKSTPAPLGQDPNAPMDAPAFSVSPSPAPSYSVQEQGLTQ